MEILKIQNITRDQITDEKITVSFVEEALKKFPAIISVSFDKGFHSPENQEKLRELLPHVILPKKGKLSRNDQNVQNSEVFTLGRKRHSGIESTIHAVENHGLDVCPDRGLPAFRRYVAYAVLARNLQVLGNYIRQKALEEEKLNKVA
ncbi:hypothetical protein WDW89_22955 [Deltaproteobacteria bacterium TL4]